MTIVKAAAAAVLLACGSTLAFAQTTPPQSTPSESPSKAQPGAPDQSSKAPTGTGGAMPVPGAAAKGKAEAGAPTQSSQPAEGTGSRAIGPPASSSSRRPESDGHDERKAEERSGRSGDGRKEEVNKLSCRNLVRRGAGATAFFVRSRPRHHYCDNSGVAFRDRLARRGIPSSSALRARSNPSS